MVKFSGLNQLNKKLEQLNLQHQLSKRDVIVGYTASYATYVHEMTMKHQGKPRKGKHPDGTKKKGNLWDPQGKAGPKFLESAAREYASAIGLVIANTMKVKNRLDLALYAGGLLLQRESQKRVPVDTGNLKNSAFTRFEK